MANVVDKPEREGGTVSRPEQPTGLLPGASWGLGDSWPALPWPSWRLVSGLHAHPRSENGVLWGWEGPRAAGAQRSVPILRSAGG